MKNITHSFLGILLMSCLWSPVRGQIDAYVADMETSSTIHFNSIIKTYNLDPSLPTVVITWSAYCQSCLSLMDRYNEVDKSKMNVISINTDTRDFRERAKNLGYPSKWENMSHFYGNLEAGSQGFDSIFQLKTYPIVLIIRNNSILHISHNSQLFPYRLFTGGITEDVQFIWNSPKDLNSLAWEFYLKVDDTEALQEAKKWVLRSMELEKYYNNTDTYAALLYKTGAYTLALKTAKEAIEIAKENGQRFDGTTDLIQLIIEEL